ncbi:MAG: molybdate transport system substrate-binding protein [Pseudonocardiales bacterium]|jgi:molybdate transport system substrate-binding protein|nr:molybdate transport system substrate-binding protein [Pseudonocardiales bacterium]MDT7656421.1 molybdate transport system substrate-binding protein [Pseudonocardiales bacterium]MDT7694361.1 molybdate transport system substrate-binding protein [Pseudonocardiales bacterium]
MKKSLVMVASGLLASALVAGCGGGGASQSGGPSGSAAPGAATLTVSAAASLTDVFNQLGKTFESQNPGSTVRFNYGGSSDLAQQIVNGAPADVFAAANTSTMATVSKAGLVSGDPSVFVTNVLQIAVAPGDPKGIHTFADLTKPDLKVVVCAPQVPCGSAATQVEKATGVTLKPVSQEADVRSALSKVSTGDADAALVYVTDVKSSKGKVEGVDFPEAAKALNQYPIAVLKNAPNADLAAKFVALVRGADGQQVLKNAGFGTP